MSIYKCIFPACSIRKILATHLVLPHTSQGLSVHYKPISKYSYTKCNKDLLQKHEGCFSFSGDFVPFQ
ncbi:hypothetical protein NQ314_019515 [Rhamnusium bicolor]|uniref:Uncharacterized protein n=1 Tax=Rhamnusium bicolor TaxID=1586634 RepID=A0AAV8WP99_9CUCU|nr:hypothetical protein NQ314_019515 [Rhamnusium bicolor]